MLVTCRFYRHSPFRQHKTKDKHEIDRLTLTYVSMIRKTRVHALSITFISVYFTKRITASWCKLFVAFILAPFLDDNNLRWGHFSSSLKHMQVDHMFIMVEGLEGIRSKYWNKSV